MAVRSTEDILQYASSGGTLDRSDVISLLTSDRGDLISEKAREIRGRNFGNRVFTYGFVYFSTHCRNNCRFCYYRHSNHIDRYRKTEEETVELAGALADSGVNLVDLTMGEDSRFLRDDCSNLIDLVSSVKNATGSPIMVSPGLVNENNLRDLRAAGADWYACYQETHNRDLFRKLRVGQDYELRMESKSLAAYSGLLTEEGIMTGIGETADDIADSLMIMRDGGFRQVRAMTFVPQDGAPLKSDPERMRGMEVRIISVLRILCPDRLIPASMDVEGVSGLASRIDAGANVITSIVPPRNALAGVAQHDLDIENGNRSFEHIEEMLDNMGFRTATTSEYRSMIEKWRCADD